MRILNIIYSKNPDEIFNRKSALGSYINCLAEILLEGEIKIFLNGENFKQKEIISSSQQIKSFGFISKIKSLIPLNIKGYLRDKTHFKKLIAFDQRLINRLESDVILEFYTYGSQSGYLLSKNKSTPLIVVYDSPVLDEYEFFNKHKPILAKEVLEREEKTLNLASIIIVYSNAVKNYLIKKYQLEESKFNIHQNVDFTRFEFLPKKEIKETLTIGFVGSFLTWHRVDLLIRAFNELREQGLNLKLSLIGDGLEFDTIRTMVYKSKFSKDISLPGFLDGESLTIYKKQIDIGVMPSSNWYGAPNKIFEYGASNMSVIAPDTPTILDLFDVGEEVLLFKNNDLSTLVRELKRLCEDSSLRIRLSENLNQKIKQKYSKENTQSFYLSLINKALEC